MLVFFPSYCVIGFTQTQSHTQGCSFVFAHHSLYLEKNTSHSASFFRAAASQLSLMLSHILKYAPSHSLSVPCISKKILHIQHLFSELLRHSFLPGCGQEDVPVFQLGKLATENGLEPSTSSVTGWHSNQLNYSAKSSAERTSFIIIYQSLFFVKHYF